jgi:DNA repair protein RecO (recombination protein O)
MAPVSTPAVLLRSHDYGDTSRILRFYTEAHGLLSVMARGVRTRSGRGTTTLATFATGTLTAYVNPNRDLHTMKDFDCTRMREGLGLDVLRFGGASATAELVLAHADQERNPELLSALEQELDSLESVDRAQVPAAALSAVWRMTQAFGFAPQLDPCVRCGEPLADDEVGRFDFASGGVRCARCAADTAGPRIGPIARAQIATLLACDLDAELTYTRRHLALLSDFVAYHVVSKPLKSLSFLGGLLPPDDGSGHLDGNLS